MKTLKRSSSSPPPLSPSSSLQDDNKQRRKSQSSQVNDTHTTISYPLPNNLTAIFKVRFHVHRGNELVWQYPPDVDLQGVEYQLICSGLHLVKKDIIYFSRKNGIGVGVFENRETDHDRGASMQAIGVLIALPSINVSPGPLHLWQHVSFLEKHLAHSPLDDHDDNDELKDYYQAHKYQPNTSQQLHYYITPVPLNTRYFQPFESVPYALTYYVESSVFPLSSERLQQQQQWHLRDPSLAFSDMVQCLGPSVFILWKAILLKQRILMMTSTPPMEQLCSFVYNGYLMDQWQSLTTPRIQSHMGLKFNIGINDINELESSTESSYIACTSDTIFDFKKDLYDVLIKFPSNNHTTSPLDITTSTPIRVNAADHVRYNLLMYLFPLNQNDMTTSSSSPLPPPSSWWAFYRYEWITWWEATMARLARQSTGGNDLLQQRTQRYPLFQPTTTTATATSSNHGSMHMLEDTTTTTTMATAAAFVEPSQQPISIPREVLLGDPIGLEDPLSLNNNDEDDEAATARALVYNSQPDQVLTWGSAASVIPDTLNTTLLGFFHVLSLQLVSSLQTLVDNEEDQQEGGVVILGIQDMVRLGLDPWEDRYLVDQLGQMYFNKRISVSACHDLSVCCCCCSGREAPIQI